MGAVVVVNVVVRQGLSAYDCAYGILFAPRVQTWLILAVVKDRPVARSDVTPFPAVAAKLQAAWRGAPPRSAAPELEQFGPAMAVPLVLPTMFENFPGLRKEAWARQPRLRQLCIVATHPGNDLVDALTQRNGQRGDGARVVHDLRGYR